MDEELNIEGMELAFESTYKLVTGKISIEKVAEGGVGETFILYDPFDVSIPELKDILNDIIDYYIESEEYEKCQEIKNILESGTENIVTLIEKITLPDTESADTVQNINDTKSEGLNSIDNLISLFKQYRNNYDPDKLEKDLKPKKYIPEYLSAVELWSLMTDKDKTIFEDDYSLFTKWTDKLDDDNKKYYSERLISNLPLIPVIQEELYNKGEYTYDYSSLVVTMIGEFVCISNYSKEKIDKLQKVLINLGIVDSEIRTKKGTGENDTVYTLVYSSKQPPKK
tara:strand:+ start:814 stop:1662 length:849 start_codon:yes stop_codon:yes gene_type:complete